MVLHLFCNQVIMVRFLDLAPILCYDVSLNNKLEYIMTKIINFINVLVILLIIICSINIIKKYRGYRDYKVHEDKLENDDTYNPELSERIVYSLSDPKDYFCKTEMLIILISSIWLLS